MEDRTYWEFINPTEVILKITHGYGGTASNAKMHFTQNTGDDITLNLLKPRLTPGIHSSLTDLSADLTTVSQVQCRRELQEGSSPRCKVEITREDGEREIIRCDEIEGLPA